MDGGNEGLGEVGWDGWREGWRDGGGREVRPQNMAQRPPIYAPKAPTTPKACKASYAPKL